MTAVDPSLPSDGDLGDVAREALDLPGIESVAIFVRPAGATELELAAAAGVAGPPLEALKSAVKDPAHPIARTLDETTPTFDVLPVNPGGPRLRSHLPLVRRDGTVVGVLAVAHEPPLAPDVRAALERLATSAARDVSG